LREMNTFDFRRSSRTSITVADEFQIREMN
jgi:hypothetical protein